MWRLWKSERWEDCGGQIGGTMVEIREMGTLWKSGRWDDRGGQRDLTMVEIREMGRSWTPGRYKECGDQRDDMMADCSGEKGRQEITECIERRWSERG